MIQAIKARLSRPQSAGQAAGVSGAKAAVELGVVSEPMSEVSMSVNSLAVKDIANEQDV